MGKRTVVLGLFAGTGIVLSGPTVPATARSSPHPAYPILNNEGTCTISRTGFTYRYAIPTGEFVSGVTTNVATDRRDAVNQGLTNWTTLRNQLNQAIYAISLNQSSGAVFVYNDTSLGSQNGAARCVTTDGPLRIRLNPDNLNDPFNGASATSAQILNFWRQVSAHEAGHMLGLNHTGRDDNTISASDEPYMATCLTNAQRVGNSFAFPRIDDAAHASRRRLGIMTANSGFEQVSGSQPVFWVRSNAIRVTGSPQSGASYMQLTANESNVRQTVHVQWSDQMPGTATSRQLTLRYGYKHGGTNSTANFKVYARGRNLNAGGSCNYPGGLNYNNPGGWTHTNNDPAQWPLVLNQNRSVVSSSWTTSQNSFVISTSSFNNIRRHMNAFHVRVTNGGNHAVFVDNVDLLPS
jgi:hypothetical protein